MRTMDLLNDPPPPGRSGRAGPEAACLTRPPPLPPLGGRGGVQHRGSKRNGAGAARYPDPPDD